jgi:hemoglobin
MQQVTEDQISALVRVFYERARQHEDLGILFNALIVDWDHHLSVVQDFWSHVLLGTSRYKSHPYPVHVGLPIKREHFEQWLGLFRPVAVETLPAQAAATAIARAELMAQSFRAGLFPLDPLS